MFSYINQIICQLTSGAFFRFLKLFQFFPSIDCAFSNVISFVLTLFCQFYNFNTFFSLVRLFPMLAKFLCIFISLIQTNSYLLSSWSLDFSDILLLLFRAHLIQIINISSFQGKRQILLLFSTQLHG